MESKQTESGPLDTKVQWWQKQANQFKAELDQLNPRLNVAEARIKELEATVALLTKEKEELERSIAESNEDLRSATNNWNNCQEELQRQVADRAAIASSFAEAESEVTQLRTAIAKKNSALAPCLKGVAAQLELLQQAIEAGSE